MWIFPLDFDDKIPELNPEWFRQDIPIPNRGNLNMDENFFRLFLESFLPWRNPGDFEEFDED